MDNTNQLNVVIVEDEPLISIFIKRMVEGMGENVVGVCYNSTEAIKVINSKKPDLIFMDINIEGPLDGISVIRTVSLNHNPSIFFVSAYSDQDTISDALATNPYNYIIKPIKEEDIKIAVTLARIDQNKIIVPKKEHLSFSDDIYYDLRTEELYINSKPVLLTAKEKELLKLFVVNINQTLPVDKIKKDVWKEKNVSDSTLRDAVSNLRKKIPKLNIHTSFGVGYALLK